MKACLLLEATVELLEQSRLFVIMSVVPTWYSGLDPKFWIINCLLCVVNMINPGIVRDLRSLSKASDILHFFDIAWLYYIPIGRNLCVMDQPTDFIKGMDIRMWSVKAQIENNLPSLHLCFDIMKIRLKLQMPETFEELTPCRINIIKWVARNRIQ